MRDYPETPQNIEQIGKAGFALLWASRTSPAPAAWPLSFVERTFAKYSERQILKMCPFRKDWSAREKGLTKALRAAIHAFPDEVPAARDFISPLGDAMTIPALQGLLAMVGNLMVIMYTSAGRAVHGIPQDFGEVLLKIESRNDLIDLYKRIYPSKELRALCLDYSKVQAGAIMEKYDKGFTHKAYSAALTYVRQELGR